MHAYKTHPIDHELLKWLLMIVLVLLLVLVATRTTAAEPVDPTLVGTVTARVESAFLPNMEAARPVEREEQKAATLSADEARRWQTPTARRLWDIFARHEKREFEAAIDGWRDLSLFASDEPWRTVAVGSAHLQLADFDNAMCVLMEDGNEPNAVTYHLRGVVHWMNGRLATRKGKLYLAEEYRESARENFEKAIATSTQVQLDEKLGLAFTKYISQEFGRYDTVFPKELLAPSTPRVRDLLAALDLEDFVVKSHLGLAEIALQDGLLEEVEDHLDDAADKGADVADLYMVLGDAFEADGASMSAARMYMKAMTGKKKVGPAIKAVRSLRNANPLD